MSFERTPEEREAARRERERRRAGLAPEPPPAAARLQPAPEPRSSAFGAAEAPNVEGSAPRRRAAAAPPPRRRRTAARVAAVLVLALVAFAVWFLISLFEPGKGPGHGRVVVRIPAGAGVSDIGSRLADRGVVGSGFFFALRARLAGDAGKLRAGTFVLRRDMSYGAALDALTHVRSAAVFTVTIPEGRSIREAAPLARAAGLEGSYLQAASRRPPAGYGAPRSARTLEGFLFPATYELKRGSTADALVAKQLQAFRRNMAGVSLAYARRKNLTAYDVLIIASMVEREAATQHDRPLIAAVIYNRLRRHMPLQIDATTRFALNDWTHPLRNSDFPRSGAYDTRHRPGLPPTPIGNPGLASIRAAAHPARVGYLYYVAQPGRCDHYFTASPQKFDAAVARYQRARERLGGRSPTKCP